VWRSRVTPSAAASSNPEPTRVRGGPLWRDDRAGGILWIVSTLLIVDDHAAVRAGLVALVEREPHLDVLATAADAEGALALAEQHAPELALIDFHLPGEDGLSLCLRLDGTVPRPKLVLYSAFADDLLGVLGAVAGVDALVPKSADPEQLLDTLLAVADGRRRLSAASHSALTTVGAALEPADLPVLGMLVHGVSADEVAETLSMTPEWLLARRWAILRKLAPRRTRRGALADVASILNAHERQSPTR
jgi:DNA-binding NarL/FixJ family response regulator